jgi:putative ABC transport system permease protein
MIIGMPVQPALRHLLDAGRTPVTLPAEGLVMTDKLAELLALRVGDEVDVDLLEGDYATRRLPLAGVIDEAFGLQAYARADWLARELREEPRVSAMLIRVDAAHTADVRARLKQLPEVLGVTSTEHVVARYREQTGSSMLVMTLILTLSAAAIAIGVVYNNARIALSARSRDLASLRVLGFSRAEISRVLIGGLAVEVLLAVPIGLWLGKKWGEQFMGQMDQETFRWAIVIAPRTYALATAVSLLAATAAALWVRRSLDRLDLIGVLKTRE